MDKKEKKELVDDFISDVSTSADKINDKLWHINPKDLKDYFKMYVNVLENYYQGK